MVEFEVTLVASDRRKQVAARCSLPDSEWALLLAFLGEVEALRMTRFVQEEQGGQVSLTWNLGEAVRSQARSVDSEAMLAMLMRLRPFVLQGERYYFHSIKNLLARRLTQEVFRKHLDSLHDAFMLRRMQPIARVQRPGRNPLSVEVVMDWLNAFDYHRDVGKRARVEADLGIFGRDQDGRPIILFALVDIVQAVLALGDFVVMLRQIADGTLTEVTCPPDWLTTP